MSHIVTVAVSIKNLDLVSKICKSRGFVLEKGKNVIEGVGQKDVDAVIGNIMHDTNFCVGFKKNKDGYDMVVDKYYMNMSDLQFIADFPQIYTLEASKEHLRRQGYSVKESRNIKTGEIELSVSKN
jgi:hypothetical protein